MQININLREFLRLLNDPKHGLNLFTSPDTHTHTETYQQLVVLIGIPKCQIMNH